MKLIVLLVWGLVCLQAAAQSGEHKWHLSAAVLHRITPIDIHPEGFAPKHNIYINRDEQLTSGGVAIGMAYSLSQRYYVQYNQIIRYGYIHGGDLTLYTNALSEKHKGVMTDLQLVGYRKTHLQSTRHFLIGLGYSLMNRGTKYEYLQRVAGAPPTATQNLNFSAAGLSLGYQFRNNFQLELMNYYVHHPKFHESNPFLLLEGRASYHIAPFKKIRHAKQ